MPVATPQAVSFHDAISNRLAGIQGLGQAATAQAQSQSAMQQAQRKAAFDAQQKAKLGNANASMAAQQQRTNDGYTQSLDTNRANLDRAQQAFDSKLAASRQAQQAIQAKSVAIQQTGTPAAAAAQQFTANPNSTKRQQVIDLATKQIGTPYSWGGGGTKGASKGIAQGKNTVGFDCSGLVQYVYGAIGMSLPRTAAQQGVVGKKTSISSLQPGDLVAWDNGKHIAVYAGNGEILEAPKTGLDVRRRKLGSGEKVHGVALDL